MANVILEQLATPFVFFLGDHMRGCSMLHWHGFCMPHWVFFLLTRFADYDDDDDGDGDDVDGYQCV